MNDLIESVRKVARSKGYAVGLHGSQKRDLDLIAVPWEEGCSSVDDLVQSIKDECNLLHTRQDGRGFEKPHGRLGYILIDKKYGVDGNHKPIDLSVVSPRESDDDLELDYSEMDRNSYVTVPENVDWSKTPEGPTFAELFDCLYTLDEDEDTTSPTESPVVARNRNVDTEIQTGSESDPRRHQ